MNKMYEYLQEHNYISRNKNKDPFRQQELSKERAECIANKYNSLCEDKDTEIERLNSNCKTLAELLDKEKEKNKKAIEYIDRRDIEWGSEEHNKLFSILKGSDKE